MIAASRIATIVTAFIEYPADRTRFNAFFELAFHFGRGLLAQRLRAGFRLPLDQYSAQTGLNDCTLDCLATLFASEPGRPFRLVLDYFGAKLTSQSTQEDIAGLFGGLIAGHMRQELHRMKNTYAPQQANLKRRIREIMRTDEFGQFDARDMSFSYWKLATRPGRRDCPVIDEANLNDLILKAVQAHPLMPDRCRAIFAALDGDDRFRNAIPSHLLMTGMVRTLTGFEDWEPQSQREPDQQYMHDLIASLSEDAVSKTITKVLVPLAIKRGLAGSERQAFADALRDLFADYTTDGDHDVLPRYVKERLASTGIEWDLKRHKYIWETVVNDCKDRLRQSLRDNDLEPSTE